MIFLIYKIENSTFKIIGFWDGLSSSNWRGAFYFLLNMYSIINQHIRYSKIKI